MNLKSFSDSLQNGNKPITITLTLNEWNSILMEAEGHLAYWGEESKAVDKLSDLLDEQKAGD